LARLGVEVVQSDRGGDITFHGPGQLVVYPIVRLNDRRLSVGGYVRALEMSVISALGRVGITAQKDPEAIGIWVPGAGGGAGAGGEDVRGGRADSAGSDAAWHCAECDDGLAVLRADRAVRVGGEGGDFDGETDGGAGAVDGRGEGGGERVFDSSAHSGLSR